MGIVLRLLTLILLAGTTALAAEREGLRVALQLEPPILDPAAGAAAPISEVTYRNVFEPLVRLGPDGSILPALARRWEISADGRVYDFYLQPGVRFHDGTPFDANVARDSLERARAPQSINPQKEALKVIDRIQVVDALHLRLQLHRRAFTLLQTLALPPFVMEAPNSAAGNATQPVGTGPFRFERWNRGESIVLKRNEDYWGTPAALGQVTFRFIGEASAAYASLMSGDVDFFPNYPAPESLAQFQANPRFQSYVGDSQGETLLVFNHRSPLLKDLRIRQALSLAIDRQAIVDGAMYGYGRPIGSHYPPSQAGYVDLTGRYPHDPARARVLLAEAGHGAGFALELKLPPTPYARRAGEIVVAQLAQVGVRVRVENLEWAQWIDQVFTRHDFDLTLIVHAEPFDYEIYGRSDYYFGYDSQKVKALLADLDNASGQEQAIHVLGSLQQALSDDAVNGFLFQYPKLSVWDRRLSGLEVAGAVESNFLGNAQFHAPAETSVDAHSSPLPGGSTWMYGLLAGLLVLAIRRGGWVATGRRLLILASTLLLASVAIFFALQIAPGDPARYMLGINAAPEAVASLRRELGLGGSIFQQYWHWFVAAIQGDLGVSYTYRVPVINLVQERLPVSLPLAVYALLAAAGLAFPLAIAAVRYPGSWLDRWLLALTQIGIAIPNFWFGILLTTLFSVTLHWVPAGGFPGWASGWFAALKALTLPAFALAIPQAAILWRVLRTALLETLAEDYLRTARAKGAGAWRSLWHHALPNAMLPTLSVLGMQFSFLLAGGVVIENVFFIPGLGRLVFQAVAQRDLVVVQGCVLILVAAVVFISFVTDILSLTVDPRVNSRRHA